MKVKKLVLFFWMAVLPFSVTGCESARNVQDQGKTETCVTEGQDLPKTNISNSQSVTYEGEEVYRKDGQEASLNEEVEQDGCTWAVSSIEITKELGNRPQAEFHYWGEARDDAGSLTGNQSYVFVTVSCKNSSGSAREVLLNSNGFVWEDESGQLFETGSEARYISKKQSGNESAEKAFHYSLDAGGETGWIELGYIMEDCFAEGDENLYYCVGTQGSLLGNPDNRYIKVGREQ